MVGHMDEVELWNDFLFEVTCYLFLGLNGRGRVSWVDMFFVGDCSLDHC